LDAVAKTQMLIFDIWWGQSCRSMGRWQKEELMNEAEFINMTKNISRHDFALLFSES
jgi:hypothetical protein